MKYGLRKGLEDIAYELKGIKNFLSCMWQARYKNEDTDLISPELFADEYISTEECARRLGVSDQTIRNWILTGKKNPAKGWVYGVHYINLEPLETKRQLIRIPWNNLIKMFTKNTEINVSSFHTRKSVEKDVREERSSFVPDPSVPKTADFHDEDFIQGY